MPGFFETKLRRHGKLMHELAKAKGSPFEKKDEFGLYSLVKDFKLFRRGHSRRIFNILRINDEDHKLRLFDYRFIISGGNSHIPYYQTVFFIQSNKLSLPYFRLVPRKFYHNLLEWIGFKDDIDYIGEPVEKLYRIHTDARELFELNFDEEVRHFLTRNPGWTVEGLGYFLIIYRKSKLLSKPDIKDLEKYGLQLFDHLKNKAKF